MQKIGFRLQLKMETIDQYIDHHSNVWPEMLQALSDTGWSNYSLFIDRRDGSLFGYVETEDIDKAKALMAEKDVNTRWQKMMGPFFERLEGVAPDEGFFTLEKIFHLE